MGGTVLAGRLGMMRAFGETAGGIDQQVLAAGAQDRRSVDAPAINGEHFFQDLYFKRDVIAHLHIICKTRGETKKAARPFDWESGIS